MALINRNPIWALLCFLRLVVAQFGPASGGSAAAADLSALVQTLASTNAAPETRIAAVRSLEQSGLGSASALPTLIDIFINKAEDQDLRLASAKAIKAIPPNEQTVPAFMVVLKDKKEPLELRRAAFAGYSSLASSSPTFLAEFAKLARDTTEDASIREQAGQILANIAAGLANAPTRHGATLQESEERLAKVDFILSAFRSGGLEPPVEARRARVALDQRRAALASRESLGKRILASPWIWIMLPLLPPILCLPIWLFLWWQNPLALSKLNRARWFAHAVNLPGKPRWSLSFKKYLLAEPFQRHPRVLDAWLEQHWSKAIYHFEAFREAADRRTAFVLPVRINQREIAHPGPSDFRDAFQEPQPRVLICGEAGSGKATLALQMARWAMAESPRDRLADHRMLPVILTDDLAGPPESGAGPWLEAVARQVRTLCNDTDELSPELLLHLLREKRLLIIAEDLFDLPEELREGRLPSTQGPISIPALVATSRFRDCWKGPDSWIVETLPIEGCALPGFVGGILSQRGERGLLAEPEILQGCLQFIEALSGRPLTAFLAKLCAERLIAAKMAGPPGSMPATVPELILSHVSGLNRRVPAEKRLGDETVQRLAKSASWKCVEARCRNSAASRREILSALGDASLAEPRLAYLEQALGLLRATDLARTRFRVNLDVLAEYLAAFCVLESLGGNEGAWRQFLAETPKRAGARVIMNDFILALRDCCLANGEKHSVPDFVEIELGQLAGLNRDALERARLQRQMDRLTRQLDSSNVESRKAAAAELGSLGAAAADVLPILLTRLREAREDLHVRCAILAALRQIGADHDAVMRVFVETLRDPQTELRSFAERMLTRMGTKALAAVIRVFRDAREDEDFRVVAAATLGHLESDREAALPALIQVLRDRRESERLRAAAAETLGRMGPAAEPAATDLIDLMRENRFLCQCAAKALLAIAPAARTTVMALMETIHPDSATNPREILAAFRGSFIQSPEMRLSRSTTGSSERIRKALEEALQKASAAPDTTLRLAARVAMPLAG